MQLLNISGKNISSSCLDVIKKQSFIKRVQRSTTSTSTNLINTEYIDHTTNQKKNHLSRRNNKFLTHSQKLSKLRHYREVCSMQKVKILTLSKKIARMRSLKQKLSEKIGENAKRGDISAIIHNLTWIMKKACFQGKENW